MALKKWVSLARLQEYDALNKNLIGTKLSLPKDSEGNMIEPTEGQVYGYTDGRFNWITPITSWEQLEDKPFGVCETEKFEPATVNENTPHFTDSNGTKWYKISDATPAMNDLDTVMYNPNGTGKYAYAHTLSHGSTSTCWWDQIWGFLMVFYSTTAVGYNGTTYEVPSTGVYVPENRISWWFKILNTKRIDEEYIPDTIARVTDIPEVLGNVGKGTKSVAFNDNAAKNATGKYSFAEGTQVQASGEASHAEGSYTVASGMISHAEGSGTIASGTVSHAEGSDTESSGRYSHAEGSGTLAAGNVSHAEGLNTYAHSANQHVQGKYNEADTSEKYAHIVGNGTSNSDRSNAHTLDWSGNAWFAGEVYTGGTGQDDTENVKKLATEDYINENAEIVPIDKLADYGATVDVTEGEGTKTYRNYVIYLNSNMSNPINKIFKIDMPDDKETSGYMIKFTSANGTTSAGIYYEIHRIRAAYLMIHKLDSTNSFQIINLVTGAIVEIEYDTDGNLVNNWTTYSTNAENVLTHLNKKANSDSYVPSLDTDVATKKYVDDNAASLSKFVFNISTEDDITFTADKTFAEIQEAYNAGKDIIAVWSIEGTEYNFTLQKFWADEEICFVLWPNHSGMMMHFYIKPDNTIEWFYDNMLEDHRYGGFTTASKQIVPAINEVNAKVNGLSTLPTVTASDNGKILQVVDGQWALVDPSTLVTDDGNGNVTLGGNTALNGNEVEY